MGLSSGLGFVLTSMSPSICGPIASGGQPSPGGSRLRTGDLRVQDMGPLGTSVQEEPIQGIRCLQTMGGFEPWCWGRLLRIP